jgi:hypothetical protein
MSSRQKRIRAEKPLACCKIGLALIPVNREPLKLKAPAGPRAASARQPSPRTAFERENIVSLCLCKDLSGNFVVIVKSYLIVDRYLDDPSGLEPEVHQKR